MGLFGGSQTTSTDIPDWLTQAAQAAIAQSQRVANLGFTPWTGPDVAAFTPMQNAAFRGTNQAAGAYGLGKVKDPNGMAAPTNYGNGVRGYSSMPLYQQALDALKASNPDQYNALMNPGQIQQPMQQPMQQQPMPQQSQTNGSYFNVPHMGTTGAGFASVSDMFNGGGPGAAGQGGGILQSIGNIISGVMGNGKAAKIYGMK